MDSNTQENVDSKSEFPKPINDAANRKYRRRSPMGGSSSTSDGSPRHDGLRSNVVSSRNDSLKVVDRSRKDGDRNSNRDLGRAQSGRGGDLYQYSDRHSSRSHHRDDDQGRHGKHETDYELRYSKSSHYSGRESRESKYLREDKDNRSREYLRDDTGIYSRENTDGSANKSMDKDSSDRVGSTRRHSHIKDWDEDRDRRRDRDDRSGRNGKTYDRSDKVIRSHEREGRGKYDDVGGYKEQESKQQKYHPDGLRDNSCENDSAASKKPKFSLDSGGPGTTDLDIDAAKTVAMRAAELVNKNLAGSGYMSADQKKKLLWGNKKNTTTEESGANRWDGTMFGDRERQEKFNKLMGVKKDGGVSELNPDTEKQRERLQTDLEKQYTAGLRRRDGRTVGLGL